MLKGYIESKNNKSIGFFMALKNRIADVFAPDTTAIKSNHPEGGFILLIVLFAFIVFGAVAISIMSAYIQYQKANQYYALGQKVAIISRAAHIYVQEETMEAMRNSNCVVPEDPACPLNLNDYRFSDTTPTDIPEANLREFGIDELENAGLIITGMEIGMIGIDLDLSFYALEAPFGDGFKLSTAAPTALLVGDITLNGIQNLRPSYLSAFKAGAMSEGLTIGFPVNDTINQQATLCGTQGQNAFVRWGESQIDCLTEADFDDLTGETIEDEYDFVSPTWIAAQAKQDKRALYRFPQPGLPLANTMMALRDDELVFTGDSNPKIENAFVITVEDLNVANQDVFETPVIFRGQSVFCPDTSMESCTVEISGNLTISSEDGTSKVIVKGGGFTGTADDPAFRITSGDLVIATYLNVAESFNGNTLSLNDYDSELGNIILDETNPNNLFDIDELTPPEGTEILKLKTATSEPDGFIQVGTLTGDGSSADLHEQKCIEMGLDCALYSMGIKNIEVGGDLYLGSSALHIHTGKNVNEIGAAKVSIQEPAEVSQPSVELDTLLKTNSVIVNNNGKITADRLITQNCFGECPDKPEPPSNEPFGPQ